MNNKKIMKLLKQKVEEATPQELEKSLEFFDMVNIIRYQAKKEVFDDFIKVLKEFSSFTTYDYVNDYRIKELKKKHLKNQKESE